MGKATRKKTPPVIQPLDGPTPEQIRKGGVEREDFIHADLGQRVTAYVNRGGTPLARWLAEPPSLSPNQAAAIQHCLYLWRMAGTEKRVTANYGERIPGSGSSEIKAANEIEARQDLHRIQGYVPAKYWSCFENVIRWDEPAGVAGSKLGFTGRACDRAHTIVCFVADLIFEKERL